MSVTFEGVTRRYDGVDVIDELYLDVPDGSFTVVTGPPKSGKSVLFRTLVGLETPDAGRILIDGEDIAAQKAPERRVGYVPQSFALYPHMSVARNIGYPMALARAPKADIAERVDWAASMLAISHLLEKTPDQLSGGEKQRVAVARGLLKEADVFVFDDPLVGLDYKLRERLMDDLRELREELGKTFLYGTADSVEAMTLATRIVVLDGGRVVQEGPTESVYVAPRHPRAMELVGFPRANLLSGRIEEGILRAGPIELPVEETHGGGGRRCEKRWCRARVGRHVDGVAGSRPARCVGRGPVGSVPARRGGTGTASGAATVGFRPEALRLVDAAAGEEWRATESIVLDVVVRLVEDLGSEIVVYVEAEEGTLLTAVFAAGDRVPPALGATLTARMHKGDVRLFPADGGVARLERRPPEGMPDGRRPHRARHQALRRFHRRRRDGRHLRRGRGDLPARPVRLRQDHADAHGRRSRERLLRAHPVRRKRRRRAEVGPATDRAAAARPGAAGQSTNGSRTRIVSSRSGEVDSIATGHPMSSSIRRTYLIAAPGRSAHRRAPAVLPPHPSISS